MTRQRTRPLSRQKQAADSNTFYRRSVLWPTALAHSLWSTGIPSIWEPRVPTLPGSRETSRTIFPESRKGKTKSCRDGKFSWHKIHWMRLNLYKPNLSWETAETMCALPVWTTTSLVYFPTVEERFGGTKKPAKSLLSQSSSEENGEMLFTQSKPKEVAFIATTCSVDVNIGITVAPTPLGMTCVLIQSRQILRLHPAATPFSMEMLTVESPRWRLQFLTPKHQLLPRPGHPPQLPPETQLVLAIQHKCP
mmetsp:Transcript_19352/g.48189  ORF Transcript_19352/g.48189 Transcript_19352/m.48189 type:complete len:250 (-) Transcript_19352:4663-5412(-)